MANIFGYFSNDIGIDLGTAATNAPRQSGPPPGAAGITARGGALIPGPSSAVDFFAAMKNQRNAARGEAAGLRACASLCAM